MERSAPSSVVAALVLAVILVAASAGCTSSATPTASSSEPAANPRSSGAPDDVPACPAPDTVAPPGTEPPPAADAPPTGDLVRRFGDHPPPTVRWAIAVGAIDADSDQIDGIAVGNDGTTTISGVFHGEVDIGDEVLTSRGAGDIFLAQLTPRGTLSWIRHYGSTGDDNTYDLAVDGDGNVVLSGWFSGTVDFGDVELTAAGDVDAFVAKVDAEGEVRWARAFGGPQGDGGNEIAVRVDGEIAVSVMTAGDLTIDGRAYHFGGGQRDALVIRMSPDGDVRWIHRFDGTGNERIRAMALGADGTVAVGFQYRGRLRSGATTLDSRGGWDGALARLDPTGELDWVLPVGDVGTDNVRGVGIAPDGSIYAAGVATRAVAIGDEDAVATGAGGDDYVFKATPEGTVTWLVTLTGDGRGVGAEIVVDANGVIASSLLDGEVAVRRGDEPLASLTPPGGRPTALAVALDPDGALRFVITPTAQPPAGGAFGDVLDVAADGRTLVQAIRFADTVTVGSTTLTTPGTLDSAVLLVCLDDR